MTETIVNWTIFILILGLWIFIFLVERSGRRRHKNLKRQTWRHKARLFAKRYSRKL